MYRTLLTLTAICLCASQSARAAVPASPPHAPVATNPFNGQPASSEQLVRANLTGARPGNGQSSAALDTQAPAPVAPVASSVSVPAAKPTLVTAAAPAATPATALIAAPAVLGRQGRSAPTTLSTQPALAVASGKASCACDEADKKPVRARAKVSQNTQHAAAQPVKQLRKRVAPAPGTDSETDGLMPLPVLLSVMHNGKERSAVLRLKADGTAESYRDGDGTPWGRLVVLDAHAVELDGRVFCVPGFETQFSAGSLPVSAVPLIQVGR